MSPWPVRLFSRKGLCLWDSGSYLFVVEYCGLGIKTSVLADAAVDCLGAGVVITGSWRLTVPRLSDWLLMLGLIFFSNSAALLIKDRAYCGHWAGQDMKENIKVAIRLKPLDSEQQAHKDGRIQFGGRQELRYLG